MFTATLFHYTLSTPGRDRYQIFERKSSENHAAHRSSELRQTNTCRYTRTKIQSRKFNMDIEELERHFQEMFVSGPPKWQPYLSLSSRRSDSFAGSLQCQRDTEKLWNYERAGFWRMRKNIEELEVVHPRSVVSVQSKVVNMSYHEFAIVLIALLDLTNDTIAFKSL